MESMGGRQGCPVRKNKPQNKCDKGSPLNHCIARGMICSSCSCATLATRAQASFHSCFHVRLLGQHSDESHRRAIHVCKEDTLGLIAYDLILIYGCHLVGFCFCHGGPTLWVIEVCHGNQENIRHANIAEKFIKLKTNHQNLSLNQIPESFSENES